MDARDFCVLAGFLATRTDAAACRSAISRAYYSLFHVIYQYMISSSVPMPKKSAECHDKVYKLLFNCQDEDLKKIALRLNDLRSRRNEADYDLKASGVEMPGTARTLVEMAKRATESFDRYCQDTPKIDLAMIAARKHARFLGIH